MPSPLQRPMNETPDIFCLKWTAILIGILGAIGSLGLLEISSLFIDDPLWYFKETYDFDDFEMELLKEIESQNPALTGFPLFFFISLILAAIVLLLLNVMLVYGSFFEMPVLVKCWIITTSLIGFICGILGLVWLIKMPKGGSQYLKTTIGLYIGGISSTGISVMVVIVFYRELISKNVYRVMEEHFIDHSCDKNEGKTHINLKVQKEVNI